jgi:hypothetical protein
MLNFHIAVGTLHKITITSHVDEVVATFHAKPKLEKLE